MSAISAAKSAPKTVPPSSTFSELLRRSKFAAYDPSIRQAYSAPPSYIHRGNWGLKRPIANRSRRGAIVLRKFEEHAQYIEWNRAEHQVKMLRAVEEMNMTPTLVPQTPWFIGLGQAATSKESGFDSDFCPGESPDFVRVKDERYKDEEPVLRKPDVGTDDAMWDKVVPTLSSASSSSPSSTPSTSSSMSTTPSNPPPANLDALGNGGKGAYGAKAPLPSPVRRGDENLLQPNIQAMTPVKFEKYVESLRKLRPQFLKYMREQLEKDWLLNRRCYAQVDPKNVKDEELVSVFGLESRMKYLHMSFLGRYTTDHMFKSEEEEGEGEGKTKEDPVQHAADMANRPSIIRKQPHKLGGLMYAMPTQLETFLTVKPQPGFILQDIAQKDSTTGRVSHETAEYVAAFGGLTSHLLKKHAGSGVMPLYDPSDVDGLIAPRVPDPSHPGKTLVDSSRSEQKMRVISLELEDTPTVVGEGVSNTPLATTRLRTKVVVDGAVSQMFRENPYLPGSRKYSGLQASSSKASLSGVTGAGRVAELSRSLRHREYLAPPKPAVSSFKPALPGAKQEVLLDTLKNMLAKENNRFLGFGRASSLKAKVPGSETSQAEGVESKEGKDS